jgi:RecB family endonuclease NucS
MADLKYQHRKQYSRYVEMPASQTAAVSGGRYTLLAIVRHSGANLQVVFEKQHILCHLDKWYHKANIWVIEAEI